MSKKIVNGTAFSQNQHSAVYILVEHFERMHQNVPTKRKEICHTMVDRKNSEHCSMHSQTSAINQRQRRSNVKKKNNKTERKETNEREAKRLSVR